MSLVNMRLPDGRDQPLQEIALPLDSEPSQMWLVYHKDMRQSARVRALQDFLRRRIQP